MKRLGMVLLVLGTAAGAGIGGYRYAMTRMDHGAAAGSAADVERKVLYWYDPMHPQQKFDKPGKSPFMDMLHVPKY